MSQCLAVIRLVSRDGSTVRCQRGRHGNVTEPSTAAWHSNRNHLVEWADFAEYSSYLGPSTADEQDWSTPLSPVVVSEDARVYEKAESVNHPAHYGGDTPYEAIKVIEAWGLGFNLGNTVKYISRAEHKGATLEDLKKSLWYLQREIANREKHIND